MGEPRNMLEYDRDYKLYKLDELSTGKIFTQSELIDATKDVVYSVSFLCYVLLVHFVYCIETTPKPIIAMIDILLAASISLTFMYYITYYEIKKSVMYLVKISSELEVYKDVANYLFVVFTICRLALLLVKNI